MTNHTPGPWKVVESGFDTHTIYIVGSDGNDAAVLDERPKEENLRLIAAAPDLLEALREIIEWDDRYPVPGNPTGGIARAAIEKATGEE